MILEYLHDSFFVKYHHIPCFSFDGFHVDLNLDMESALIEIVFKNDNVFSRASFHSSGAYLSPDGFANALPDPEKIEN